MTRRTVLANMAANIVRPCLATPANPSPVVNGAEHAWVVRDPRFPMDAKTATCPISQPNYDYSAEYLLSEMRTYGVDHVVISHVCYYGADNRYPSYAIKAYSGKFAGIGLLVGYRLYSPADRQNASRLDRLIREDGLIGLRLSPIYDRETVWLNDPVCYALWKKAEESGAVFNIFLAPHQVGQVADMAARFAGGSRSVGRPTAIMVKRKRI